MRTAAMRVAYLLICLKSPQDYYGFPSQDTIHILNVAVSALQARQAFFDPITRAVGVQDRWFFDKCDPKPSSGIISWGKHIEAISGHADADSQEGYNIILGIADEIDGFKTKDEFQGVGKKVREPAKSAEGILEMLESSALSRFPGRPDRNEPGIWKNVRISYPRYLGSMIQVLTKEARTDIEENGGASQHYVSGPLPTWEVKPNTRKEDFANAYKRDAAMAKSKYECAPALAINPYFRNPIAVEACMVAQDPAPISIEYIKVQSSEALDGFVWEPVFTFAPDFYAVQGATYVMHGDLASTGDRAGIAMAHCVRQAEYESTATDEEGLTQVVTETRPSVKVDFVLSFTSDKGTDPPREIQIRWARNLCFELVKRGFNIRLFSFDRWQCLSGDTAIPLLDGTTKTMKELAGSEPFWVYSIKDGRVVPGLCTKAWKTGHRTDMLEVELDNGEKIRCTSNHPFMLRDGSYRMAMDLRPDDSLMPLYRRHRKVSPTSKDYEELWHPEPDGSGKRWRFTHSMVSHYCYGPLPKGSVTHHRNCNPLDNRPDNLAQLTNQEHSELHRALVAGQFSALWKDPEWSAKQRALLSELRKQNNPALKGEEAPNYRHDITFEAIVEAYEACVADGVSATRPEMQRRLGCSQSVFYDRVRSAGYSSWKAFRQSREVPSYSALATRKSKAKKVAEIGHEEYLRLHNHKVVAVRQCDPEDVYDLQVEEHHNFATAAGVFVHNSTDSMQILRAKGIESKRVSTDISEEPWKNLRDLMYENRISMPLDPLLKNELLRLSRLPNGKVDHLPGSSKDLADSVACSAMGAVQAGGEEAPEGDRAYYAPVDFTVSKSLPMPMGMEYTPLDFHSALPTHNPMIEW